MPATSDVIAARDAAADSSAGAAVSNASRFSWSPAACRLSGLSAMPASSRSGSACCARASAASATSLTAAGVAPITGMADAIAKTGSLVASTARAVSPWTTASC